MPQLKHLSCSLHWGTTGAPFQEYGTVYGDGLVESYIVVPSKPQSFTIRLRSLGYIHEGLAMLVFIDGRYQANRNRVNLKPPSKDAPVNRTQIDFQVRQKEKPIGEGVYMGRQWRFDNHGIVEDLPNGVKADHFELLGTIEVFVLRCRARVTKEVDESGSSSAADSDALGERRDCAVDEEPDTKGKKKKQVASKDGASDEDYSDIGFGLFASEHQADGHPHRFGLDGDTPGYYGWPPTHPAGPTHGRNRSQHFPNIPPHPHQFPSHNAQHQPTHGMQTHAPTSQRHVHFDLGTAASTPPQRPTHRPQSYERNRPTTQTSTQHHHRPQSTAGHEPPPVPVYGQGLPSDGGNSHPNHHTTHHPFYPGPFGIAPPGKLAEAYPVVAPSYNPYPPHQQLPSWTYGHQPQRFEPWPVYKPPHMLYYPCFQGHSPWWPKPEKANSSNSSNTADSRTRRNSTTSNQTQPGSSNQNQTDDSWLGGNDNQSNQNPNTQSANNNNDIEDDWVNGGTSQTDNNANQSQNGGGGYDWRNPPKTSDNTWGGNAVNNSNHNSDAQNEPDSNESSGGGWNNNNDTDQSNQNLEASTGENNGKSMDDDTENGAARALFGPHGPYYTYNPRGPNEPPPDAEEEPRFDVPRSIANATGSTKQVLPGSGYMYCKKRCAPEYLDAMDEPYARFVFKYRTTDQLEKEIGLKLDIEPTGDEAVQELQSMDKQSLIEMLVRAKGALGGRVPSPPTRSVKTTSDQILPIPVEPPFHPFLQYKLPELRYSVPATAGCSGGSNGGGTDVQPDWNNNDTTSANTTEWDTHAQNNNPSTNTNVDWQKTGDGAGESSPAKPTTRKQSSCFAHGTSLNTSGPGGANTDQHRAIKESLENAFRHQGKANLNGNSKSPDFDWTKSHKPSSRTSSSSTILHNEPFQSSFASRSAPPAAPQGSPVGQSTVGGGDFGNQSGNPAATSVATPKAGW